MTKVRDITLPLRKAHKLTGDDMEMLDFLFELKISNMNTILTTLNHTLQPSLVVAKLQQYNNMIMLMMFLPPEIWMDFDHQKYQIFIAPDLTFMISHFVERRMRTQDIAEAGMLTRVVEYLQSHLANKQVSHTWQL